MKYTLGFRVYLANLKMVIVMLAATNATEKHIVAYCLSDLLKKATVLQLWLYLLLLVLTGSSYWFTEVCLLKVNKNALISACFECLQTLIQKHFVH